MKNTLKMFGIIAIAAVIGFWAVSCGDDDGGGGGNAISGNTITSGAEVVYDSSIEDITEARNVIDFCFTFCSSDGVEPLSNFLDGSPSVTVNNNKVSIILGTPKAAYLYSEFENGVPEGVTVNPINAKLFNPWGFYSSNGKYSLDGHINDNNYVQLGYVDRNLTIKGSFTYYDDKDEDGVYKINYNVSFKKGWNYLIVSYNETTKIKTYTSSTTQPSGLKWTVYSDRY
jgi:hypothetical protein